MLWFKDVIDIVRTYWGTGGINGFNDPILHWYWSYGFHKNTPGTIQLAQYCHKSRFPPVGLPRILLHVYAVSWCKRLGWLSHLGVVDGSSGTLSGILNRNTYSSEHTQRKEGGFGVLRRFQQLRSYCDKTETRNQGEIPFS